MISILLVAGCGSGAPAPAAAPPSSPGSAPVSSPAAATPSADATPTLPVDPAPPPAPVPTPEAVVSEAVPATPTAPPAVPRPVGQGPAPTTLTIPSIAVDEQLIELGIADDGTAEVPADYDRAGWFADGGRPGGVGPTVLLGHVDSLDGPAVFHRLRDVPVGADISVGLADGTVAQYRVVTTAQYAKDDFPTFEVYGATLQDTLTLITCGGPFDTDALSYTENVVVTAHRV